MSDTCPVPTPEQRRANDIVENAQARMMDAVLAAVEGAAREVEEGWRSVRIPEAPPPHDYFAAVVHQRMFLLLCGADAERMTGGDPVIAGHLIGNQQKIAEHYWTAKDGKDATS